MADGTDPRTQPSFLRTALWLGAFIVLGILLRSVFVTDVGYDDVTQRHMLTGNDPYFHHYTTEQVIETGRNVDFTTNINYPEGRDNPNPPVWTWTSALVARLLEGIGVGGPDYVGLALNLMVAFWGALCAIPVYMIARDLWSRRAGLWAAFFLTVSAPHIERSIWGYADHDAISMFFILLAFAFIVRGLKVADLREHVAHWGRGDDVRSGLRLAIRRNHDTLVYAALAGISITACALIWKGFPYVFGILGVAAFFQMVLDHLRNRDSTITWMVYAISVGLGILLPWLLYYQDFPAQIPSTILPSLAVLGGILVLGLFLVPTRDMPSIVVFPALALVGIAGFLFLVYLQPGIWGAISSGLGYFQTSKLYSTIAEAQRPQLGEVAAKLGFFTFLAAFWGFFRTVRIGARGDGPSILVASWAIVAIFMMFAAHRFQVNAAPVFAVLLGYAMDRIWSFVGTDEVRKRFRSQHGQNPVARSFRSLSFRPVALGALVVFLVVLPSAWLGVDAALPYEYERDHVPGLADYSTENRHVLSYDSEGRPIYGGWRQTPRLGAFGQSFDELLGTDQWIRIMEALAARDTSVPLSERPAFIGWWDYGHWALDIGRHPTVADPFQSHYELSGRFLASDSEQEGIAWLTVLLLNGNRMRNGGDWTPEVRQLLAETDPALLQLTGSYGDNYRVLSTSRLNWTQGDPNAIFGFYDRVCETTDTCVGYMAVSSRMYPSARGGIFYAPVYLADKNPDDYIDTLVYAPFQSPGTPKLLKVINYEMVNNRSVQLDTPRFVEQQNPTNEYVLYNGYLYPKGQTPAEGALPESGALYNPSDYQYQQPASRYSQTMFARAFGGEIASGRSATGGDISQPAGDGLAHWRVIKQTTRPDQANDGTPVERRGAVLLAYFRGVTVNGTVVDDAGEAMANVQVTFRDASGATHGRATTDANGTFSVVAPFSVDGDLRFEVLGSAGRSIFNETRDTLQFTEGQAQAGERIEGVRFTVPRGSLSGRVFDDTNANGVFDAGNETLIAGANVTLSNGRTMVTGSDGSYRFADLQAADYNVRASQAPAYSDGTKAASVPAGGDATADIPLTLKPVSVKATFLGADGRPASFVPIQFTSDEGRPQQSATTNATGVATVSLGPGAWTARVDHNVTLPGNGTDAQPVDVRYQATERFTLERGAAEHLLTLRQQAAATDEDGDAPAP